MKYRYNLDCHLLHFLLHIFVQLGQKKKKKSKKQLIQVNERMKNPNVSSLLYPIVVK